MRHLMAVVVGADMASVTDRHVVADVGQLSRQEKEGQESLNCCQSLVIQRDLYKCWQSWDIWIFQLLFLGQLMFSAAVQYSCSADTIIFPAESFYSCDSCFLRLEINTRTWLLSLFVLIVGSEDLRTFNDNKTQSGSGCAQPLRVWSLNSKLSWPCVIFGGCWVVVCKKR